MVKYLVTGGCGFIGSHLVDLLVKNGHSVTVLDNLSNSTKKYLPEQVEWVHGSITDPKALEKALNEVEGVFHLAAMVSVIDSVKNWYGNHLINSSGTVQVFERAKHLPIVYTSSAAVYGDQVELPLKESHPPLPLSPYAVDKLANELHAKVGWHVHRTPSIGFRLFNIYGPRQNPHSPYSGVIALFAEKIAKRHPISIYGEGTQTRDFVYVKDVAQILAHAMQTLREGAHLYNLCTGVETSINTVANLLEKCADTQVQKEHKQTRSEEVQFSCGDPTKLLQELDIRPQVTLEQGLTELMHEIPPLGIVR